MMSATSTSTLRLALALALPLAPIRSHSSDVIRTFEGETVGRPPAAFVFRVARESAPAHWVVQREGANSYLAHVGEPSTRGGFSLALLETPLPDGATFVSARTRRGARSS